jgi:hypothetical protein
MAAGCYDTLLPPSDSSTFYFSLKNSWKDTTQNALDTFVNTWFSEMLYALNEPVLKNYSGDKEIYRFTWLRSFHHPVSLRLEKQCSIIKLYVKMTKGAGGYEPGKIKIDTIVKITTNEWEVFANKIEALNFWSIPTESREETGTDGSEWVLEGFFS